MKNWKASFLFLLLAIIFCGSSILFHQSGIVMGNPSGMIGLAVRNPRPIPDPPAPRLTVAMLATTEPGPWKPLATTEPGPWKPLATTEPGPWKPLATTEPGPWRPLATTKPGPWKPFNPPAA
jgi:hypothetical protein